MQYNQLGQAGLRVSELSFGSWITFAKQIGIKEIEKIIHTAFDQGINFFDTAEGYAQGEAEVLLGKVLDDFRREDLVLSTKLFWGGDGPNDTGLSRKHLIEGTKNSLKRLNVDYVDLLFCHRPDPNTPIHETVLAMDHLIRQGYVFYWGTSEWSATQIEAAFNIADHLNCIRPTMEQPRYNLFARGRVEIEYQPLYDAYQLGTTIWSPLASGILSGKYNNGIPADSRFGQIASLKPDDLNERVAQTLKLSAVAKTLNCTLAQLALAWCLKNPHVSSVITGATKTEQLVENIGAIKIKDKITPDVMHHIDDIVGKPHA